VLLKPLVRIATLAGMTTISAAALAGPSDHSFAWTQQSIGSATLLVNGSSVFTASNRGWVNDAGANNFGGTGGNYIAGICGSSDGCGGSDDDHHNYFAFNVVGLTGVSSAVLRLYQPSATDTGNATQVGFLSQSSSLSYTLWDALLDPTSSSGMGLYNDLASGASFGSIIVDASTNGTTVSVTLNANGLTALQAAAATGGAFYLGGAIGAVPEPETYALMLLGLGAVGAAARRRKS